MSNKPRRRIRWLAQDRTISRGRSRRLNRFRRGTPIRHINMVPDDATPDEAHAIEMRERARRRQERSNRVPRVLPGNLKAERRRRDTTDPAKVQKAHERRERRNFNRLIARANGGWR